MAQEKNAHQHLIRVVRGDSLIRNYEIAITDDTGEEIPYDLTDKQVSGFIKEDFETQSPVITNFITNINDAPNGSFDLILNHDQTDYEYGNHVYQVYIESNNDPHERYTILKGTFRIDKGDNVV